MCEHEIINGVRYAYRWLRKVDLEFPTVICLHGFTGTSKTFTFTGHDLNYLAIDLIGHGDSSIYVHPYRYQMSALVRDLAQLVSELDISSFYLLGYSMGGRVALSWMLEYPRGIKGVIIESGTAGISDTKQRHQRQKADDKLAKRLLTKPFTEFIDYWEDLPLFHSQKKLSLQKKEAIRMERLSQHPFGLAMSLMYMGTGAQKNYWPLLSECAIPLLYIAGEWDRKFNVIGLDLVKQNPEFSFQLIRNCGHCCHIEQPRGFEKLVTNWIKEKESEPPYENC
ncbi:2-succinyl-6-hydroxy-2,4-cyclohexadiene-1-carboxylate synthase [Enterococcus sp. 10A9_DIV0425]|uniref:Putative 2-succinyl-6-hydroxy-2,4-cyclohexadiene-1-carboxylate synthase n=1 Tax=Candidatus Enterococcus wittei TaxID=1987383 RepID=A0A2C9XQ66_9ENTE|nr:2-succinyl-6-hydroxy-2,4-cyclohexadiene-1-carboxylate synthase [Enterococcus sp. 10A9_DIV0425]OTP11867.1 2-succinyl-6-hydroxy-2,4-cyclohexadiene-1-carboxylate synthase [Enterococcus sp. 10A9_DIV0425]